MATIMAETGLTDTDIFNKLIIGSTDNVSSPELTSYDDGLLFNNTSTSQNNNESLTTESFFLTMKDKRRQVISDQYVLIFVFYYTPLLVTFGVIANTLTCMVLLVSALRKFSSSHYLAALTIINNIYLILLLLMWIPYNVYHRPMICQLLDMFTNASSFLSLWLAVAFCVDRYISISWPAESSKMCTATRAKIVVICLVLLSLIIYLNISLTVDVYSVNGVPRCRPLPLPFRELRGLKMLDLVVNHMLPFAVVVILLLLICRTIYWEQRGLSLWQEDPSQIRHVTMVFFIAFVVTHSPIDVYYIIQFIRTAFYKKPSNAGSPVHKNCRILLQYLSHTGMATNMVILLLCYPLFRQYLLQYILSFKDYVVKKCCGKTDDDDSPENIRLNYPKSQMIVKANLSRPSSSLLKQNIV